MLIKLSMLVSLVSHVLSLLQKILSVWFERDRFLNRVLKGLFYCTFMFWSFSTNFSVRAAFFHFKISMKNLNL